MKNDLLKKIKKELDKKKFNESCVVFVMSKIRKIIESEGLKDDLWVLNFYCDWMSHLLMNRATAQKIIQSIENKLGSNGIAENNLNFIKFDNLKEEINIFLKKFNLPALVDNNWKLFRNAILETIIECPLEKTEGPIKKLYFTSNNNITNLPHKIDGKMINLTLEMGDSYREPETNSQIRKISVSFIDGILKI